MFVRPTVLAAILPLTLFLTTGTAGCLCHESTRVGLWGEAPGYFETLLASNASMDIEEPRPNETYPIVHDVPFGPTPVPETDYTLRDVEYRVGETSQRHEGGTTTWYTGITYRTATQTIHGLFSDKANDETALNAFREFLADTTALTPEERRTMERAFVASRTESMNDPLAKFKVQFTGSWKLDEFFHELEGEGLRLGPPQTFDELPVRFQHEEWTFTFDVRVVETEDLGLIVWASERVYWRAFLDGHDWDASRVQEMVQAAAEKDGLPPLRIQNATLPLREELCSW